VVAAASELDQGWAVWARVSPAPGQVLDLLHARMAEPFAPHVHDGFSIGACIEGLEMIRYRDRRHYAAPGSVVILPPGEAHTGGPSDGANFVYRVMYPTVELLGDGAARPPCFPEPVVMDPALAAEMRRVHAAMSRAARGNGPPGTEPVGAERVGTKLLRSFRAEVGMPPYAWLAQHRVARARVLLEQGHRPADAATLTGFADQAHLTRWFRRVVGVTPGAYRNGVQDSRRPHR
jgi:hypothetical protein